VGGHGEDPRLTVLSVPHDRDLDQLLENVSKELRSEHCLHYTCERSAPILGINCCNQGQGCEITRLCSIFGTTLLK